MQGELSRQANAVAASRKYQTKKAGSKRHVKKSIVQKATATASPTQSKELRYQEKKSAVVTAKAQAKFVATNETKDTNSGDQEHPSISIFDCSENGEAFDESAGADEESSGSASHEFDSTHNTSTTSQEENDEASESQSNSENFNGIEETKNEGDQI